MKTASPTCTRIGGRGPHAPPGAAGASSLSSKRLKSTDLLPRAIGSGSYDETPQGLRTGVLNANWAKFSTRSDAADVLAGFFCGIGIDAVPICDLAAAQIS